MTELAKTNEGDAQAQNALELINDKWAVAILQSLKSAERHYGELLREVEGITRKMLTQTLRNLERSGIIQRREYNEGKINRVAYFLTPLGRSLTHQLTQICLWSLENMGVVRKVQAQFDTHGQAIS
jgi:DNA-binding HxlR family transcriptional regulator